VNFFTKIKQHIVNITLTFISIYAGVLRFEQKAIHMETGQE
jgi:hypothetical protein